MVAYQRTGGLRGRKSLTVVKRAAEVVLFAGTLSLASPAFGADEEPSPVTHDVVCSCKYVGLGGFADRRHRIPERVSDLRIESLYFARVVPVA